MTPRRFGVRPKNNIKNGISFEPWVLFRKRIIYFEIQKTKEKAAIIHDVANYWLKVKGGDHLNSGEEDYNYFNFVQEFHPQESHNEHEENQEVGFGACTTILEGGSTITSTYCLSTTLCGTCQICK